MKSHLSEEQILTLFRDSGHALSRHWEDQPRAARKRRRPKLLLVGIAAALVLAWVAMVFSYRPARQSSEPELFVRIPYVVPAAPYERTQIVRMDVPVAALVAAGGSVPADVLVAQDGRALAVSLFPGDTNK